MNSEQKVKRKRRQLQIAAGICALGAGAGMTAYWSRPSNVPMGDPVSVDLDKAILGAVRVVEWNGYNVWLLRRSPEQVDALSLRESQLTDPDSNHSIQPESCRNRHRSIRPEIFVAIGQCTHMGCQPQMRNVAEPTAEFLCPCHSSKYDLAGRIFRLGPAPANLVIPSYHFEPGNRVVIGQA